MLAIQAFCCFIPYMFWTAMQQSAGINLGSVVGAVLKAAPNADERNKQIEFAARSLDECLLMQCEYRSGCSVEISQCLNKVVPHCPGKSSGCQLTISYLWLKLLFVLAPLAQIWFMARYMGRHLLNNPHDHFLSSNQLIANFKL